MASHGASQGPVASSAAALRKALLLPLALSTSTGIVALALTAHVHAAVVRQNEDERELRAIDCLYRGVLGDEAVDGKPNSTDASGSCDVSESLRSLEEAAQKHTPIAGRLRSVDELTREWLSERQSAGRPAGSETRRRSRETALLARLTTARADLEKNAARDDDGVRRRLLEMLAAVAAMSIATGALVVLFVRRRLKVLSYALGEALQSAEQTSHLKDEFMATLSHELKTPINAVLGWTTLLRRRADDPATVSRAVDRIDRNARRQARLIDDMVDMFSIATGQLTLSCTSVDVASAVEWTVGRARQAAQTKGVSVVQGVGADVGTIWGDPRRVRQILGNLLDHAVKSTASGGHVLVDARSTPDSVEFRVSDTRRGAPTDAGAGLGLTIVHRLVALHGGTFRIESPGDSGGDTFVVNLPPAPYAPPHRAVRRVGV